MFTGIITDIGCIEAITGEKDISATISTHYDAETIALGASIACSGVCLTVTDKGKKAGKSWFSVQISGETLSCTTLSDWREGTKINLERALKLGDELGGHLVLGHVDGIAEVLSVTKQGDSHKTTFNSPLELAPFIAEKGSITLDGVSLTVNQVDGTSFSVNIIPHSWKHTTLCYLQEKSKVNMEIDMFARYIARLVHKGIRD